MPFFTRDRGPFVFSLRFGEDLRRRVRETLLLVDLLRLLDRRSSRCLRAGELRVGELRALLRRWRALL